MWTDRVFPGETVFLCPPALCTAGGRRDGGWGRAKHPHSLSSCHPPVFHEFSTGSAPDRSARAPWTSDRRMIAGSVPRRSPGRPQLFHRFSPGGGAAVHSGSTSVHPSSSASPKVAHRVIHENPQSFPQLVSSDPDSRARRAVCRFCAREGLWTRRSRSVHRRDDGLSTVCTRRAVSACGPDA